MVKTDSDKYPASHFAAAQQTLTQKEYVKVARKKTEKGKTKVAESCKHKGSSKVVQKKVKKQQTKLPFTTSTGNKYWKFVRRPFAVKKDKFPYKSRKGKFPYRTSYS